MLSVYNMSVRSHRLYMVAKHVDGGWVVDFSALSGALAG